MGITFDSSVNVGHLLTIGFGCVAFVMAWGRFSSRLDLIELRVATVEKALEKVATALLQLGANDKAISLVQADMSSLQTTIGILQRQIEDLRRGEGFIQAPRRGNIDGEYSRSG